MSDNNLDANKITKQAVKFFGDSPQLMVAQEECGELIAAISQYIRGRKDVYALAEEVADVEIMCMQLKHMIGSTIVDTEKNKKLTRLAERLGMRKVPFGANGGQIVSKSKGQVINCRTIVYEYLETHGYDGLYCDECGCELSDLMPCGGEWAIDCVAGYKYDGCTEACGNGCDFHIGPKRD